jgi:Zn finger protein HypA/HybF involved in hydrogenase expression
MLEEPGKRTDLTSLDDQTRLQELGISKFQSFRWQLRCESCKREYDFKDDKVVEIKRGRDLIAESQALDRSLRLAAMNRRCDNCGGPMTSHGVALCCDWCHQEYRIVDGQVQTTTEDSPTPRLSMRDFYALHAKR